MVCHSFDFSCIWPLFCEHYQFGLCEITFWGFLFLLLTPERCMSSSNKFNGEFGEFRPSFSLAEFVVLNYVLCNTCDLSIRKD